ncbi:MAG: response regulator [Desulfuromonadia bacterium]
MGNARILIADDEADIATILKLQLEDAGYRTSRARDGIEVLETLSREPFDILLLDLRMPRMDGMKTLEQLRIQYPDLPVVIMTAHGSESVAVDALHRGAMDYVAKPFSFDDLKKRIERALEFTRAQQENRRLQEALAAEQQKIAAILEGVTDMLVAVDRNGRVVQVNRAVEDFLGIPREQLLGKMVTDVIRGDLSRGRLPCLEAIETNAPVHDVSYTIAGRSGLVPILSNAAPLMRDQTTWGGVEILRDVSRLKELEQEKEDFVSMLSHDLKSPITAIVGSLDLVREGRLGPVNEEQREFLDDAAESCSELVDMIDTLLDIHKFESGKMTMSIRPEDPVQLLQRVASRYRIVARRAEISFVFEADGQIPPILLDRQKFTRLAGNLLSNAFKFTPSPGVIRLTLALRRVDPTLPRSIPPRLYPPDRIPTEGRYLELAVSDTGPGIPRDLQTDIFDRFVQGRNRRLGKVKGSGLGLAFCRKVMDAHNGLIWVESEPGDGSTFRAIFPLDPVTG